MIRLSDFSNDALSPRALAIASKMAKTKEGALRLLGEGKMNLWVRSDSHPGIIRFCYAGITAQIEKTRGHFYYQLWVDQPYMVVSEGQCSRLYDAKRAVKREIGKLAEDFAIANSLLDRHSGS